MGPESKHEARQCQHRKREPHNAHPRIDDGLLLVRVCVPCVTLCGPPTEGPTGALPIPLRHCLEPRVSYHMGGPRRSGAGWGPITAQDIPQRYRRHEHTSQQQATTISDARLRRRKSRIPRHPYAGAGARCMAATLGGEKHPPGRVASACGAGYCTKNTR